MRPSREVPAVISGPAAPIARNRPWWFPRCASLWCCWPGAGLLVNSFLRLRAVDPGFRADRVLTATLSFASTGDEKEIPRLRAEHANVLARVRAMPGVQAAGTTDSPPLEGGSDGSFKVSGRTLPAGADADYSVISSGYLRALRIPILSGRDFTDADIAASAGVAIVNSEMARRYSAWPQPAGRPHPVRQYV